MWGRQLQLIDCQNSFCEVSKYARVKHPDITGVNDRNRIKQVYRPSDKPIEFCVPAEVGREPPGFRAWEFQRPTESVVSYQEGAIYVILRARQFWNG